MNKRSILPLALTALVIIGLWYALDLARPEPEVLKPTTETAPANVQPEPVNTTPAEPKSEPVKPAQEARPEVAHTTVQGKAITESNVLALINQSRIEAKLRPLTLNSKLRNAAQGKAEDMAERNYFAHENPDGHRFRYWLEKAGYTGRPAGENLAVNFTTVQALHQAWLNSPSHKAVIMNPAYRVLGVGIAVGQYKEREGATYVAAMFGV